MKILFVSLNHLWSFQYAVELELIEKHIKAGDEVYVLYDGFALKGCISNPFNLLTLKLKAEKVFYRGMAYLNFLDKNIFNMHKRLRLLKHLPRTFSSLEQLKHLEFDEVDFGFAVISNVISTVRDHKPNLEIYHDLVANTTYSSFIVYESFVACLDKLSPDKVYVFNGRFAEARPVVRVCKKRGIDLSVFASWCNVEVNQHEDRVENTWLIRPGYLVTNNFLPHDVENVSRVIPLVWDAGVKNKEEAASMWYVRNRQSVGKKDGSYSSEHIDGLCENILPSNLSKKTRNIAIFNSSMDEYEGFAGSKNIFQEDDQLTIKKIVDAFSGRTDIHFYLRVHPNLKERTSTQLDEIKRLSSPNLTIIWPEEIIDSYALLLQTEKCITFGSTLGVEACFWGKPSILLGKSFYQYLDCCYIPKKFAELIELIDRPLPQKNKEGALMYAYWFMNRGVPSEIIPALGCSKRSFLEKYLDPNAILPQYDFSWSEKMLWSIFARYDNYRMADDSKK